jgi:hypothetical protein
MKTFNISLIIVLSILILSGCGGRGALKKGTEAESDTTSVPDTGYTGIKKYFSGTRLVKEVTFKNGIRQGESKTFYPGGQLYQTFWFENGLREDSAKWYYLEGQTYRSTPFRHDTIDGIQIQYFRTGKVKARIGFSKGLRTPFLEEYNMGGKLIRNYPEIVSSITDNYNSNGRVRINLELSDKSTKVKFLRGEFTGGVLDTTRCTRLITNNGKAFIDLRKSGTPQQDYIGIIGEIVTSYGNRYLAYKRIDLPYNDLR